MFGRRKRDDDIIGPSTGVIKWVNKFFRFILYPFIHPVWFISGVVILMIVLVGWPAYNGIEFSQISKWYKGRIVKHYQQAEALINRKVRPLMTKGKGEIYQISSGNVDLNSVIKEQKKTNLVVYDAPMASNRRAFKKAQDVPVDVEATLANIDKAEVEPQVKIIFKRDEALGLTYLDVPEKVTGRALVLNANELMVGDRIVFLYGIYVAPTSKQGKAAEKYLRKKIDGKEIDCHIGAYASDGAATAICVYDKTNLNQQLVDLNYSKDVSLN